MKKSDILFYLSVFSQKHSLGPVILVCMFFLGTVLRDSGHKAIGNFLFYTPVIIFGAMIAIAIILLPFMIGGKLAGKPGAILIGSTIWTMALANMEQDRVKTFIICALVVFGLLFCLSEYILWKRRRSVE